MRQYILTEEIDKNGLFYICGKDYKYFKQVLRVKTGDMISVRLKDGSLENSTVCRFDEKNQKIVLQLCAKTNYNSSDSEITRGVKAQEIQTVFDKTDFFLFQFIAKPAKMEQIIRQAVECGVKYIIPVIGEFSQKSSILALQNGKKERIEKIIKEARQQSGSPVQTQVLEPISCEEIISFWGNETSNLLEKQKAAVVLWERCEKSHKLKDALFSKEIKKAALCCGCEGGISAGEIEILEKSGFVPVHFAVNILRCETAALFGLAALESYILENN